DRNPVMIFIMSLFAPPTMANDRVQQTNWALADQFFCACLRPIGWQVALRCGKRDKDNRGKWGSAPGGADLAEVMTLERSPPLLKRINWKRISNFRSARSGFVGGPAIGRSIVSPFGTSALRRLWPDWANALFIVKANTVVSWHRLGFRLFWRLRSSRPLGRPK